MLNSKKNEILSLENNYDAKINFNFDSQYSLHNPIIEVDNKKNTDNVDEKVKVIKKIKNEKAQKKKRVAKNKINKKELKSKVNKEPNKNIDLKKSGQINDETVNKVESSNDATEEKTGWWS